jgi:hypothetical protein
MKTEALLEKQLSRRVTVNCVHELAICAALLFLLFTVSGCFEQRSYGLAVESVNDYSALGPKASLMYSIANGDGFIQGMTIAGSPWELKTRWVDKDVWDRDLMDREINRSANDDLYFDQPGVAISYFTGHGIVTSGCSTQPCSTTATCTTPVAGARLPGTCRFSPFDSPRCCYMVDRDAVTSGQYDIVGGFVDYTGGQVRWGESANSGPWAGAGTNGGTNLVVLDISHGVLPPFWFETLRNACAGVHMIATLMTAGGDTCNVADRGSTFARIWEANQSGNVAQAWLDTMSALPAGEGQPCGKEGGHGFNGCGCHIVVAMNSTAQGAQSNIDEDWIDLRSDERDAKGNNWYVVKWQCNYTLSSTNQSAWELP